MVDVAQLVRALDCGSRGRGFESHLSPHNFLKLNNYDPVAQLVEHKTFNLGVPGSSPGWITSGHGGIGRRARLRI